MVRRVLTNFAIATEAVFANKVRSLLTGLGIIFGVAAVIAMLAIGSGAQQEILEQIKLVGVNNIVITPVIEQSEGEVSEEQAAAVGDAKGKKNLSLGLNFLDVESIQKIIPGIEAISPEIILDTNASRDGFRRTAKLVGVENTYFDISGFELDEGSFFNDEHFELGKPVCIIGKSIKSKFFSSEEPIGKYLKVGRHWLKVIGVLENRVISEKSISNLGIRDYNMDIYTPFSTALIRYENRAMVTNALIQEARRNQNNKQGGALNYHQLDRLVIKVKDTEQISSIAEVLSKMLKRKHSQVVDYEISIPELLLKQQQRTKNIFNFVLGGIAGISLLVGGIGIMNIMLASVLERIKEIGLRMSLGATKIDIIYQFLLEAVMISFSGGTVGVILGLSAAYGIAQLADIPTIVSFGSIILSFGVAVTVGVAFGIAPARKAASQDPITCLRYE